LLTTEELGKHIKIDGISAEDIEVALQQLSDLGISVIDEVEEETLGSKTLARTTTTAVKGGNSKEELDRTDDPVRMYLLTFEAIMVWREELEEGRILLRDIIDLDTTYNRAIGNIQEDRSQAAVRREKIEKGELEATEEDLAQKFDNGKTKIEINRDYKEGEKPIDDDEDEEEDKTNLSMANMEAALREEIMAKLDRISQDFGRFQKLQQMLIRARLNGKKLRKPQAEEYDQIQTEIIEEIKSLQLNNARIDALIDQLYMILNPTWLEDMAETSEAWNRFAQREKISIEKIRAEIGVEKVRKVMKIAKEPISLETPIGDEEDSQLGDFIEDNNAILPIDAAIQSNLRETTTRVLASLTPREERVLRMRFGIGMNTDHTLEEVGQQFSVTRERIFLWL